MIPDVLMFLPGFHDYYWLTHSRRGILTACLPLGVGFFLLFELLAKRPLIDLAPEPICRRLHGHFAPTIRPTFGFFFSIAVATLIGAMSHVLWDSFTHEGRRDVRLVPVLDTEWFTLLGITFTGISTLQHFSSVVFLPILLGGVIWWLWQQDDRHDIPENPLSDSQRWFCLATLFLLPPLLALVSVYSNMGWPRDQGSFAQFAGWSAKTAIGGVLLVCGIYCIAYQTLSKVDPVRDTA
jgi:hypothetical protein